MMPSITNYTFPDFYYNKFRKRLYIADEHCVYGTHRNANYDKKIDEMLCRILPLPPEIIAHISTFRIKRLIPQRDKQYAKLYCYTNWIPKRIIRKPNRISLYAFDYYYNNIVVMKHIFSDGTIHYVFHNRRENRFNRYIQN